jgi:hypothetical protein
MNYALFLKSTAPWRLMKKTGHWNAQTTTNFASVLRRLGIFLDNSRNSNYTLQHLPLFAFEIKNCNSAETQKAGIHLAVQTYVQKVVTSPLPKPIAWSKKKMLMT